MNLDDRVKNKQVRYISALNKHGFDKIGLIMITICMIFGISYSAVNYFFGYDYFSVWFTILLFVSIFFLVKADLKVQKILKDCVKKELGRKNKNIESKLANYIWLDSLRGIDLEEEKKKVKEQLIIDFKKIYEKNEVSFADLKKYIEGAKNKRLQHGSRKTLSFLNNVGEVYSYQLDGIKDF